MVEDWPNGPQFMQAMATILRTFEKGRVYIFSEVTGVLRADGKAYAALKVGAHGTDSTQARSEFDRPAPGLNW